MVTVRRYLKNQVITSHPGSFNRIWASPEAPAKSKALPTRRPEDELLIAVMSEKSFPKQAHNLIAAQDMEAHNDWVNGRELYKIYNGLYNFFINFKAESGQGQIIKKDPNPSQVPKGEPEHERTLKEESDQKQVLSLAYAEQTAGAIRSLLVNRPP